MRAKKYWIWFIVSFSILIVLWPAQQITGETGLSAKEKKTDSNLTPLQKLELSTKRVRANKKEVLQGLEGVGVLVEFIEPEAEKYGLTKKALQNDTELRLRKYGIKVLTYEELLQTPGRPFLYINVSVGIQEEELVAIAAILVGLREDVVLLREPTRICVSACTWESHSVASVGLHRVKELREEAQDRVNDFINDYFAANPKEPPVE